MENTKKKQTLDTSDYSVSFEKSRNKFRVRQKNADGKLAHVGYFHTIAEAKEAMGESDEAQVVTVKPVKTTKKRYPTAIDSVIDSLDGLKETRIKKVQKFYNKVDEDYGIDLHAVEDVHTRAVDTFYEFSKAAVLSYWSVFGVKFN